VESGVGEGGGDGSEGGVVRVEVDEVGSRYVDAGS